MEIIFILIYGSLLGLMAPYLLAGKENYGVLLAPGLSLVYGLVAWTVCTWSGLSYSDYWIWIITMLGMPLVMIVGVRIIRAERLSEESTGVPSIKIFGLTIKLRKTPKEQAVNN